MTFHTIGMAQSLSINASCRVQASFSQESLAHQARQACVAGNHCSFAGLRVSKNRLNVCPEKRAHLQPNPNLKAERVVRCNSRPVQVISPSSESQSSNKTEKLEQPGVVGTPAITQPSERKVLSPDDKVMLMMKAQHVSEALSGRSVFLVGMMGSGKSTVGKILSQVLGYSFFDSDDVVEGLWGTSISTIFAQHGEKTFRNSETEVLADLSLMGGAIVATGGGAVIRDVNWDCMRNGVTVWVHAPLNHLANRVVSAGIASRPLLASEGNFEDQLREALDRLRKLWTARRQMYSKADICISVADLALEDECAMSMVSPARVAYNVLEEILTFAQQQQKSEAAAKGAAANAF
eukprot:TRINITY_DN1126_c0_g1_i4.p1 TRINITY_DN1126_c0_g1~~TRINITY_DN1126_c0_g1_i4.p1  ORF type:complete len:350 (+),score=33.94 TRINITY_DN1126_c0_g1_i4:279-1328(+)